MESPVKLFISHAHKDKHVAELLIDYLSSEYELDKREIRCTSVADTDLPLGELIAERLRKDVSKRKSIGFIALLSYFGLESAWVKFELGAAWATQQTILPVLGPNVKENDPRLGPVSFMPLLLVSDPECERKLEKYIRRTVTNLRISTKHGVENLDKLKLFIEAYRHFGGETADFSGTDARAINPVAGSTVNQVIHVKMHLTGVPTDGYIWVGVLDTNAGQIWPKETLQDPHREGEHTIQINENGTPAPGALAIVIIGVGHAGNEMLKDWDRRSQEKGDWSGIRSTTIPGYKELARIEQLTLLKA